jgi:hypothetical protein
MKHPSLNIKKITIKESAAYRVRLESWESINPKGLFTVDIIQECLDKDGNVDSSSTYNFNMTRDELKKLGEGLMSV